MGITVLSLSIYSLLPYKIGTYIQRPTLRLQKKKATSIEATTRNANDLIKSMNTYNDFDDRMRESPSTDRTKIVLSVLIDAALWSHRPGNIPKLPY